MVRIDKTNPTAAVSIASQTTPGLVTLSNGATGDALSGLKTFAVHLGATDGPVVATNDAELANIGQSVPAKDVGATRFHPCRRGQRRQHGNRRQRDGAA